jgi:hypothetical protein
MTQAHSGRALVLHSILIIAHLHVRAHVNMSEQHRYFQAPRHNSVTNSSCCSSACSPFGSGLGSDTQSMAVALLYSYGELASFFLFPVLLVLVVVRSTPHQPYIIDHRIGRICKCTHQFETIILHKSLNALPIITTVLQQTTPLSLVAI